MAARWFIKVLGLAALLWLCPPQTAYATAPAAGGTEWVLILDNSASMSAGSRLSANGMVSALPATDPERLSVLATLIFRALLDPTDRLTILTFDNSARGRYREQATDPEAIRTLVFNQSTPFTGPLRRAREILSQSTQPSRVLLLVTDGAPSEDDMLDAAQARALLGLSPAAGDGRTGPAFTVHALGLTGGNPQMAQLQRDFLAPLGELLPIDSASELIKSFTQVFAAHIHSRPESGELTAGASFSFAVGRYVTAVLVSMASEGRSGPFAATLTADGQPVVTTGAAGDNGCAAPPCHNYQVLKADHDPQRPCRMTLSLTRSSGPVAYGIILRYDLSAEIVQAPTTAQVGEEIDVHARLVWHGRTFQDSDFFTADGFLASLSVDGVTQPLKLQPDGTFVVRVKLTKSGTLPLRARFANHWLSLDATADIAVKGWLPLTLKVYPDPLDFGRWRGERTASQRCAVLDLSGSQNAEQVPLEAVASGLPDGVTLEAPAPLRVAGNQVSVCLRVRGCCGEFAAPARLSIRGRDPHYHAGAVTVGMTYSIVPTPFWTCWWRIIAAVTTLVFLLLIIWGFVRPYDFDAEATIHLAKTEPALARSTGRRLRDLPHGRRGFYRDARVLFDGSGNAASTQLGAVLILRAGRRELRVTGTTSIEQKDPRTRKWETLPTPLPPDVLRRGIAYRVGDFYFRLG